MSLEANIVFLRIGSRFTYIRKEWAHCVTHKGAKTYIGIRRNLLQLFYYANFQNYLYDYSMSSYYSCEIHVKYSNLSHCDSSPI